MTIDTLGFAEHLEKSGIKRDDARAHAAAIRDVIMPEIATRQDIDDLKNLIEKQSLSIKVWLGGLLVVGIGILVALDRLAPNFTP